MKNFTLSKNLIGTVGVFASVLIAFFLIPNNTEYFPFLGVSLSLIILNTFIFISHQSNHFKYLPSLDKTGGGEGDVSKM